MVPLIPTVWSSVQREFLRCSDDNIELKMARQRLRVSRSTGETAASLYFRQRLRVSIVGMTAKVSTLDQITTG
ncbi:hypothetical protein DPEC_G00373340 [Dallia pectoralis]|nr:hypothetical protein DPEC_G00373340 [Dallia pectoralis]